MSRDDLILEKAREIHAIVYKLFDDLNGDVGAGECCLKLASVMFRHFGSPDGDNKGRTSAPMSKVESFVWDK